MPSGFEGNPEVMGAVVCAVFGLALVIVLERIGAKKA